MSVASMIRKRGSVASLYRPIYATQLDGARTITGWESVVTRMAILLQPQGAITAPKEYGAVAVTGEQGWVLPDVDVRPEDRFLVTSRHRLGERFVVLEVNHWMQRSGNDHKQLTAESTTEVFP